MPSITDYVLSGEIKHIVLLQTKYNDWGPFLEFISTVLSPMMILTVWTPLIGAFDTELLIDMLLLVSAASFGSTLLKWVDAEPRPYWWINESTLYNAKTRPNVKIFPTTCETSSGAFSTHSTVFTVFLFVIGMKLVTILLDKNGCERKVVRYGVYALTIMGSTVMWASRMYLGTHFLHQCIAGSILGLILAYLYYENDDFQAKATETEQKDALLAALACTGFVAILYVGMLVIGADLQWSTRMAFKWCGNPDYLKPTTTPVYSMFRDLGFLYGIAIASPMSDVKDLQQSNLVRSSTIAIFIVAGHEMLEALTPTSMGRLIFLLFVFARSCAFSYITGHVLPIMHSMIEDDE